MTAKSGLQRRKTQCGVIIQRMATIMVITMVMFIHTTMFIPMVITIINLCIRLFHAAPAAITETAVLVAVTAVVVATLSITLNPRPITLKKTQSYVPCVFVCFVTIYLVTCWFVFWVRFDFCKNFCNSL